MPETRQEFLEETRAQVTRLTRLATDLLDLSRLDAGQIQFVRHEIDLAEAASTVGEEFRVVAEASDHPLELECPEPGRRIGDTAVCSRSGGSWSRTPSPYAGGNAGGRANGDRRRPRGAYGPRRGARGSPTDQLEHVFQRFYRAAGGKASGSGSGLAIARELATRMAGTLSVESEPGETVFTLYARFADTGVSTGKRRRARRRRASEAAVQ